MTTTTETAAQQNDYYRIRRKHYPRIPYGYESSDWGADTQPCHDCAAVKGQFHQPGCDVEQCPRCGQQSISCGCEKLTDHDVENLMHIDDPSPRWQARIKKDEEKRRQREEARQKKQLEREVRTQKETEARKEAAITRHKAQLAQAVSARDASREAERMDFLRATAWFFGDGEQLS